MQRVQEIHLTNMDVSETSEDVKSDPTTAPNLFSAGEDRELRMTLLRAKFNFKYRGRKKDKPRLNRDDIRACKHLLNETGVRFGFDPKSNNVWFAILVEGKSFEFDGLDTGGQVIRFWLQWAILKAGGRNGPPEPMTITSSGKACMLYIQAVMYTLRIGESFTVKGGDPDNSDAPNYEFHIELFQQLREMLGISFQLNDESEHNGGTPQFTIVRLDDVEPDPNWSSGDEPLTIYMADQLMMASCFVKPAQQIILKCEVDRDYHIDAMIRVMRVCGVEVSDTVVEDVHTSGVATRVRVLTIG